MRLFSLLLLLCASALTGWADELESRALTHYLPQDFLETVVRSESWTEVTLKPYGGIRKGDVVRIWSGGVVDVGGDQPGQNCFGPSGADPKALPMDPAKLALSTNAAHGFALLFKTADGVPHACAAPGKPLEIKMAADNAKLWIGYNDQHGKYIDNHLGKGRRRELDPLWVRIEVVRIIVD